MRNNLIKKFLSFSIGGYINIFIGLLTVPITTRLLSPEQYGISSLITSVTSFMFVICCLGTEQGFVRFFYDEKEERRGKLLYNCLYYPFHISILVFFLIYIFREKISIFFLGYNEKYFWLIFIFSILFRSLNNYSFLVIRMQQKGKIYSVCNVLLKILEFIFILLLYKKYGDNYKTLVMAILLSLCIVTLFSIAIERKFWLFRGDSKISKKEILEFSIPLTLTMALNWVFASSDKIVIKSLSNITELGLYSGAFKIISLLSVLQTGFTTFWTPVVYEHYSKNPEDTEFYKKANDYLSLVFFLIGIGLLMFRNIIILLLGDKYRDAVYIMPMLIFIPVMYLLSETTHMGIGFKKKTKYYLYISIIVSITNLIGNIILVPYLGAKGAAISTGLSYIIFFGCRTYFSTKLINFNFNLRREYIIILGILFYSLYISFMEKVVIELIIIGMNLLLILGLYRHEIKKGLYFIKGEKWFI
ncbi:oligosaccharide flippase family protein [Fusobacterium mortiferum]|uniref:oligosaccharide flippase family protein n=1 Tax=Fusobacterium mortiferum TaxID=850 RepID=UPI0021C2D655|nr:oligosaccharide flippase family protein [Fusobacterium mortiferum]